MHAILCGIFALVFVGAYVFAFFVESFPLQMGLLGVALIAGLAAESEGNKAFSRVFVPAATAPTAPPSPAPSVSPSRHMTYRKDRIRGQPLAYMYIKPIEEAPGANLAAMLGGVEKEARADSDGETVTLRIDGQPAALVRDTHMAEMVRDFVSRSEPVLGYIFADGKQAQLRFYRDRRPIFERLEQIEVKLSGYKNDSVQESLEYAEVGDPVEIDKDGAVTLKLSGDLIGKVPASVRKRMEDEDISAAFLDDVETEESETDDGDELEYAAPKIRIYW